MAIADLFHFKQFSVDQSNCAMKINTDGVLLGALAEAAQPETILDIGTGTGVIALMMGQRFPASYICAVEIDAAAVNTAQNNFTDSPFRDRLSLYAISFENFFIKYPDKKYDLIIANPPFHINSLQSPKAGSNLAKHTNRNFFEALIYMGYHHLSKNGVMWLILPVETSLLVKRLAADNKLYLQKEIKVRSYPSSNMHREIVALGLQQVKIISSDFVIYDGFKRYSGQYQTVLKDFLTIFPDDPDRPAF